VNLVSGDKKQYMSQLSEEQIKDAIKGYVEPHLKKDLVTAKAVKEIKIQDGEVTVALELGFPAQGISNLLIDSLREQVLKVAGVTAVTVNVTTKIVPHAVQKSLKPIDNVKNIIAVASGKGGVGKSTVAVNVALALSIEGAKVGLLDADIYGPSQPRMLGIAGKPESKDGNTLEPMQSHGIQAMSIGFLIDEETPMIWRGPMVTQALEQLLKDTNWGELDYLVIDLPPGTGDTQLTLAQKVPLAGAIIVTTPQDIALLDARKGLKMFEKVEVPILGIVENMCTHICSKCGHEEPIFGAGGGANMAKQYNVALLGQLPLDIRIREETDSGRPTVAADPECRISQIYREIARNATAKLALQSKDYATRFPSIVIQNN
jgi:ATP-binding protein involved in chromosome partitioning